MWRTTLLRREGYTIYSRNKTTIIIKRINPLKIHTRKVFVYPWCYRGNIFFFGKNTSLNFFDRSRILLHRLTYFINPLAANAKRLCRMLEVLSTHPRTFEVKQEQWYRYFSDQTSPNVLWGSRWGFMDIFCESNVWWITHSLYIKAFRPAKGKTQF